MFINFIKLQLTRESDKKNIHTKVYTSVKLHFEKKAN